MSSRNTFETDAQQGVASWINLLNQLRLDQLCAKLQEIAEEEGNALHVQDINLNNAMDSLDWVIDQVNDLHNRGGEKGLHGFIAEIAQTGLGNAKKLILGEDSVYTWVNDNGPDDLLREGIHIQQKFVNNGGKFSLNAVLEHLEKYPEYAEANHKYQIPKDFYEEIKRYLNISEEEANRLPTGDSFSLRRWKYIQEYFKKGPVSFESLEPSDLEYREVKINNIYTTIDDKKTEIRSTDKELRKDIKERADDQKKAAHAESKPTAKEGAKATLASAAIEGGIAGITAMGSKIKDGKKIREFTEEDWKEILGETAVGSMKGGTRGVSIYALTNLTATPAAVASSLVTASFGIAEQAHRFSKGELTETELIVNSELLCLDATVSAVSSLIGEVLIPVPVLGAVIGNTVGTFMYQTVKDQISAKEEQFFREYLDVQMQLNYLLDKEYQRFVNNLEREFIVFTVLIESAYSPDIKEAFTGSIALAKNCGVPYEDILDTPEKIESYFMD